MVMDTALTKVVCIEDEQEMIELVELILSKQQVEVHGASDGAAGLHLIRAPNAP